jgi:molybdopterin molybdotransferase
MIGPDRMPQRVSRLTPLDAVFASVDAVARPVPSRPLALAAALGRVLAADAVVGAALPTGPLALRDGWAVRCELVADAGSHAPTLLVPPPDWVDAGAPVPAPADAVVAPDAVVVRDGMAEALGPAVPGEGVLGAQADAAAGQALRRCGEIVRAIDVAALHAAGVATVAVRVPDIRAVCLNATIDAAADAVGPLIAGAIRRDGGCAQVRYLRDGGERALAQMLTEDDTDAVIGIGGTGMGRNDFGVRVLAQVGTVAAHGIGLIPGETAAIGSVGARPVLLLPGRLDAALAVYLVVGQHMLAGLTGRTAAEPGTNVTLTRKLVSTVGMAEVALVGKGDGGVAPLATGFFPLHAMARADGYVLVPAASEGYPAGTVVTMRALR